MRILQVIQKPQRRGAEMFAWQLSEELRKRGHEVQKVFLYEGPQKNALPLSNGDLNFNFNERAFSETLPGWNPAAIQKLTKAIRQFHPDVVQLNAARTLKYGTLVRALDKKPRYALVYRNIGDPSAWVKGTFRRWFYKTFIIANVDGIVAVSSASRRSLQSFYGADLTLIQLPRAVDSNQFVPDKSRKVVRAELSTPQDSPVLIFVGSMSAEKRLDRLLRAVASQAEQDPGLKLWLVGTGPEETQLQTIARNLQIADKISFLGVREDVASLMNAADLHVLTSDTEGIPGVVLEAALVGLPSVATRVGGLPDCVRHGETGLLVEPDNEAQLADSIRALLHDPERRIQLGQKAKEYVLANFSMSKVCDSYVTFYEKLYRMKYRQELSAVQATHV